MKYFITGATGFIGSWVAQLVTKKGEEVHCLVRRTSNLQWLQELPVHYHYGTLADPNSLKEAVENADYVLHIAGVTKALSIQDYYQGNVKATRNLLEVVREVNPKLKKFIHVSSQAAIGPSPTSTPIDENSPANPLTDYGRSKLETEQVVREFMDILPITILRPPAVYGQRDTDVFEVFKNIRYGLNLKVGNTDQLVSIIQVMDLARGIMLAAEHPKSTDEIFFIANEQPAAWSEVINILQKLMNKKVKNISIPYSVAYLFGGVMEGIAYLQKKPTILNRQKIREVNSPYWVVSTQKIQEYLNYSTQLTLEDGLSKTLTWYLEQGWLKN